MKKTHLFLVLAAVVLTGAYNLLQNPVSDNEAQIVGTTRPQFVPVAQSKMTINASTGTNPALSGTIPFYGTFYNGQAFASSSAIILAVFKDGILFTNYNPADLVVKLGYADGATSTKPGVKQLYGAKFTLVNKTKTGTPLPTGNYAIGISGINWTYTSNGQIILSGTPTNNVIGWRTLGVQFPAAPAPVQSSINFSLSSTTPAKSSFIANGGPQNNEADKVAFLTFDVTAKGDSFTLNDLGLVTGIQNGGGAATLSTYYLYQGTTLIGSSSNGTFVSVNFPIPKDITKTFTVKADIRNADATAKLINIDVYPVNTKITDSKGSAVSYTGSVGGNQISITNVGSTISLSDVPSIDITATKDVNGNTTEAHLISTFRLNIKAIGSDISFGIPLSAFHFVLLKNGVPFASSTTTSAYYPATQPTGTTNYTGGSAGSFMVQRESEALVPVTFRVDTYGATSTAQNLPSATYSVQLTKITYGNSPSATGLSSDFTGNPLWSTPEKARP